MDEAHGPSMAQTLREGKRVERKSFSFLKNRSTFFLIKGAEKETFSSVIASR